MSETVLGVDNAKSGYMFDVYVCMDCTYDAPAGTVFSPKNTAFYA